MPSQVNPVRDRLENELFAEAEKLTANLCEPSAQFWQAAEAQTKSLLSQATAAREDEVADKAWFLHKVAETRLTFVSCFGRLKQGEFYKAWCDLERVEIELNWLRSNPLYDISIFRVDELANLVAAWQGLFPYHIFFSPEFLILREECSICGRSSNPWSECEHRKGFVYGGRECVRLVKEAEFLGISLVRDPVQKYSVPFTSDTEGKQIDQYDYAIVKFVTGRVASPFDEWKAHWTEAYHPHEMFSHLDSTGPCPCESGRQYSACCLTKLGVVRPHLQILFKTPPAPDLPNAAFAGYDELSRPASLRPASSDDPSTE